MQTQQRIHFSEFEQFFISIDIYNFCHKGQPGSATQCDSVCIGHQSELTQAFEGYVS